MLENDALYPYPCEECHKAFKRKDHLKKHFESIHSQIKYTCNFCGKQISRKDLLKRHIGNVHPSMACYAINNNNCGSSGTSSVVNREATAVASSSQNVPKIKTKFYCQYCNESFSRKDNLLRHETNVHPDILLANRLTATH